MQVLLKAISYLQRLKHLQFSFKFTRRKSLKDHPYLYPLLVGLWWPMILCQAVEIFLYHKLASWKAFRSSPNGIWKVKILQFCFLLKFKNQPKEYGIVRKPNCVFFIRENEGSYKIFHIKKYIVQIMIFRQELIWHLSLKFKKIIKSPILVFFLYIYYPLLTNWI